MLKNTSGYIYCQGLNILNSYPNVIKKKYGGLIDNSINNWGHNINNDDGIMSCFVNGYFLDNNANDIFEIFSKYETLKDNIKKLRGGFCGFISYSASQITLFVDHTGNHPLYYYMHDTGIVVSNRMDAIVEILSDVAESISFDKYGIFSLLEFGFLCNDHTLVDGVRKVEPGTLLSINLNTKNIEKTQYYLVDNTPLYTDWSKDRIIDKFDDLWTQAISRAFLLAHKNNGSKSLVELSGGLDSRMITLVSHKLGYVDQTNLINTQKTHLDYKIALDIASSLSHSVIINALDDLKWIHDYKKSLLLSNWSCSFLYNASKIRVLDSIKAQNYQMLFSGFLGDAVLSTFYPSELLTYDIPTGNENVYTNKVTYNKIINPLYINKEIMSLYMTGLNGLQSAYIGCQNYIDFCAPFLDVDILDFIYHVPFKYRANHELYIDWIEKKHPDSTLFGWERWGGITPTNKNRSIGELTKVSYRAPNLYDEMKFEINAIKKDIIEKLDVLAKLIPINIYTDINTLLSGQPHEQCMAISAVESIVQIQNIFEQKTELPYL